MKQPPLTRSTSIITAFFVVLISGVFAVTKLGGSEASAVPASQWNPGMIISDAAFYNSQALTTEQIQSFLDQKGKSCKTGAMPCLKDYRMDTSTKPADAYCGQYIGASGESAAQIIAKIAAACRINPQVLIVTLQKETSLITRSAPTAGSYRIAMGYGCPDGAACDTRYYGFFNQVYLAARQFQIYAAKPTSFSHRAGAWNTVRYNPSSACGSSSVYIQNQATASLYNYTPYQPNAAALDNLYGTGNSCSAYGNRNFWTFYSDWFGASASAPGVTYSAHSEGIGWQSWVADGVTAGTTGRALRLEALSVRLTGTLNSSSVTYSAYVQDAGWQQPRTDGTTSGTTGQCKHIEAVGISLSGPIASTLNVWYRVHLTGYGWLDWASNGAPAGWSGGKLRIEAIQIILLPSESTPPGSTDVPHLGPSITYSSHVASTGWQAPVWEGNIAGTVGQAKQMEALTASLSNAPAGSSVTYSAWVRDLGWQEPKKDGDTSGTTGQNKPLEALALSLSGPLAATHDVWYRSHVSSLGWLDWTSNGAPVGSHGLSLKLEAVQVMLLPKGTVPPGRTISAYIQSDIAYSAHVQGKGWLPSAHGGTLGGTTGEARQLEAVMLSLKDSPESSICYTTYVHGLGWQGPTSNNAVSGTTGQGRQAEAIAIALTGPLASSTDVWYRVHLSSYGWLGWTTNGSIAGSTSLNLQLEAIQVLLLPKGSPSPDSVQPAHVGVSTTPPPSLSTPTNTSSTPNEEEGG